MGSSVPFCIGLLQGISAHVKIEKINLCNLVVPTRTKTGIGVGLSTKLYTEADFLHVYQSLHGMTCTFCNIVSRALN